MAALPFPPEDMHHGVWPGILGGPCVDVAACATGKRFRGVPLGKRYRFEVLGNRKLSRILSLFTCRCEEAHAESNAQACRESEAYARKLAHMLVKGSRAICFLF